jgi:hypothetical protein
MAGKRKEGFAGTVSNGLLIKIFERTVEAHVETLAAMKATCKAVEANTEMGNELLRKLAPLPDRLASVEKTQRIIRWSLMPIIGTLVLIIIGLVLKS